MVKVTVECRKSFNAQCGIRLLPSRIPHLCDQCYRFEVGSCQKFDADPGLIDVKRGLRPPSRRESVAACTRLLRRLTEVLQA